MNDFMSVYNNSKYNFLMGSQGNATCWDAIRKLLAAYNIKRAIGLLRSPFFLHRLLHYKFVIVVEIFSWIKCLVENNHLYYSYTRSLFFITSENYYSQENKRLVVNHAWSVKPEEHVLKSTWDTPLKISNQSSVYIMR